MAHSGKYFPKNPQKYKGDPNGIVWRSSWERFCFKWCDQNPDVIFWSSEETVVPYICPTDNKRHRYFIDLTIQFKSGKTILVEVKPHKQTLRPLQESYKKRDKYVKDVLTYAKNTAKWEAARNFAKSQSAEFHIWTENVLEKMGFRIASSRRK